MAHTFSVLTSITLLRSAYPSRPGRKSGKVSSPSPSLFKQFELIYVVGDERDLVRVRTNYRNEDVFFTASGLHPKLRAGSSWSTWSGSMSWRIDPSFTICSATAARSISSAMQISPAGSAAWIFATS